ncbi:MULTISPECIES: methylated-DNA--[protein]-cysteine S-methyltransferase [Legionella]|nr:methylated-DNA--[protein]-cysteine S-methyltransferase [Legionella septentrionalis]
MTMPIVSLFNTPLGNLEIMHDGQAIHSAVFVEINPATADRTASLAGITIQSGPTSPFCELIAQELDAYFHQPNHRFQITLKPHGTAYQQRVWNALLVIPVGRTLSYGALAQSLQSSPRAVGQACKKNPITLFIPCHRVIGKDNFGGYMGDKDALSLKLALLKHEGICI